MSLPDPPEGFRMAASPMDVSDVPRRGRNNYALRILVRGAWTPARLDIGISAQPSRRRPDVPPGRQQVAVQYGEPPFGSRRRIAAEEIAVPLPQPPRPGGCPDDGACHHRCGLAGPCVRVLSAEPLSAAGYPGDRWPDDVAAAERARAKAARERDGSTR